MNPEQIPNLEENIFATDVPQEIVEHRSIEELSEIIFDILKNKTTELVNHFSKNSDDSHGKRNYMINEILKAYQSFKLIDDQIHFLSSKDNANFYQIAEKIYDELLTQHKLPAELSFPKTE